MGIKKILCMVLAVGVMASFCACGQEDTKVISHESGSSAASEVAVAGTKGQVTSNDSTGEAYDGFIFAAATDKGSIDVSCDMDMAKVLEAIGESESYFEAESCAFQGIDKTYTYAHFEIQTYPDKDADRISYIILKDDTVSTAEGAYIGMRWDEAKALYEGQYKEDGQSIACETSQMRLILIMDEGAVGSIQYESKALDKAN